MRCHLRKLLFFVLFLIVLIALLYGSRHALAQQGFSWDRLLSALAQAQPFLLLLSLVGVFASYAVRALRWQRFCRYLGQPPFLSIYTSTLIGFTAVFLLGRPVDPVRALLIARKDRLPASSMFGIYVLERIFDAASTAVLLGLSLLVFPSKLEVVDPGSNWRTSARVAGVVLLIGLLAATAFLVYFRFRGAHALDRRMNAWRATSGRRRHLANLFAGLGHGLQAIRTWSDLGAAIFYSAVHWGLMAILYLWVAHSFGGRLGQMDFSGAMLVLALTMVGAVLQAPAVGGGSQAASFLAYTVVFGVEKEPAAAASIVLWLVTFAASSLAGVPLLIKEGFSISELRRIAREEEEAVEAGAASAPVNQGDLSR